MLGSLEQDLLDEIERLGPMPFAQFVERALYDPDYGFYVTAGRAGGRRGDFVTSVEVGPLFAAVIADWLDTVWKQAGSPSPFLVTEAGAGVGTLFRGINHAAPDCLQALRYTLVERSASMRVAHQTLPGDLWHSQGEMPTGPQHVILANELLDNLVFDIAERVGDGWAPVSVGTVHQELALVVGVADPQLGVLDQLAPDAPVGSRVPVATAARAWIEAAVERADRVLVFDYAASAAELVERGQQGWLRTYASHDRGSDPLVDIGERDITHDVPVDQLPAANVVVTQADWLVAHGIEDRVEAAKHVWQERAHIGDLQAIAARSAIGEAAALTDPSGLGAFLALEWT